MLRVNVRWRRGRRFARQLRELGFDEAKIAPAVVFLGKPTRANIAGAVDQELGVRYGNPDHVLFPVVKGAGEQAKGGGHVRRVAIGDKNLALCEAAQRRARLARRNEDDLAAERRQPFAGR